MEVATALVAAVLMLIVLTATASYANLVIPYSDAHDWAAAVFRAEHTHAWLAYVWQPHTAQRIPLARLAEAVQIEFGRGRWPVFLGLAAILWVLGSACLTARIASAPVLSRTKVWLALLATVILADAALAEDFAFPVFGVYLFVAGPALAAVCLYAGADTAGLRTLGFWGALLCAALASGGNAAGLAVWPALFAGAVLQGRSRDQLAVTGIVAALIFAIVEGGLDLPSTSLGAGHGGAGHLVKMAVYFFSFCGLPWTRDVHGAAAGALIGAPVAVAAAAVIVTVWRGRGGDGPVPPRAGFMLVVFGLATAILASVGRVDELPNPIVPTRYTPFAALLQLGVALGFSTSLDTALHKPARRLGAAAACLLAVLVGIDLHAARGMRKTSDRIRRASVVFDAGGAPSDVTMHPRPDVARAVRSVLKARGLPS